MTRREMMQRADDAWACAIGGLFLSLLCAVVGVLLSWWQLGYTLCLGASLLVLCGTLCAGLYAVYCDQQRCP